LGVALSASTRDYNTGSYHHDEACGSFQFEWLAARTASLTAGFHIGFPLLEAWFA
jgi:hypothetical protein